MTLLEHLRQRPDSAPLFISGRRTVDLAALHQVLAQREGWLDGVARNGIALAIRSPIDLALALIALDGRCARLLLLPEGGLRDDEISHFMQHCRCDLLLTDAGWQECARPGAKSPVAKSRDAGEKTEWFMPTSGTTSRPKLIGHTLESLTRTTKTGPKTGAALRWGQIYAIPRFAGMQVLLQSLLGGSTLVLGEAGDGLDAVMTLFARFNVNAISATPTQWRQLLMMPPMLI